MYFTEGCTPLDSPAVLVFGFRKNVVFQHNNVYSLVKKMRCYQDVYGGWA